MSKYSNAFVLLAAILSTVLGDCPPRESVHPCFCREYSEGGMLECSDMNSPQDLLYPIGATVGYKMFSITIMNSTFLYIPHDVFKGTNYKKIRLLNSQLLALTDTDEAFEGLETTLTEFRATDAQYSAQWYWEHLRNLKKLDVIDVNWVQLDALQEDIPPLPELTGIGISRARITYVTKTAFANLPKLKILDMSYNEISELKRSMLPKPASHLSIFKFDNNKLRDLPENFFEDMPSLNSLNLRNNQFVSLSEKVFGSIFFDITEIFLEGNPFRCDCRMSWLFGGRLDYYFRAECETPESLKGRNIVELTSKELRCPRI